MAKVIQFHKKSKEEEHEELRREKLKSKFNVACLMLKQLVENGEDFSILIQDKDSRYFDEEGNYIKMITTLEKIDYKVKLESDKKNNFKGEERVYYLTGKEFG